MKSYSSREIIRKLKDDGWEFRNATGDHYHFIHKTKKGKVTVPHPKEYITKNTYLSIIKQAGLK